VNTKETVQHEDKGIQEQINIVQYFTAT